MRWPNCWSSRSRPMLVEELHAAVALVRQFEDIQAARKRVREGSFTIESGGAQLITMLDEDGAAWRRIAVAIDAELHRAMEQTFKGLGSVGVDIGGLKAAEPYD